MIWPFLMMLWILRLTCHPLRCRAKIQLCEDSLNPTEDSLAGKNSIYWDTQWGNGQQMHPLWLCISQGQSYEKSHVKTHKGFEVHKCNLLRHSNWRGKWQYTAEKGAWNNVYCWGWKAKSLVGQLQWQSESSGWGNSVVIYWTEWECSVAVVEAIWSERSPTETRIIALPSRPFSTISNKWSNNVKYRRIKFI